MKDKENHKRKLRQFWKYKMNPITGYSTKKDIVINNADKREN